MALSLPRRPGFGENRGQWPAPVTYAARDGAAMLFLTATEAVWRFRGDSAGVDDRSGRVRMRWIGANSSPTIEATGRLAATVNYARGANPAGWQTAVPLYARVVYRDLYPGIDLVFHDERGALEYDFVVSPGADPNVIRLRFDGPERPTHRSGELVLPVGASEIVHRRPIAFQQGGEQSRQVAAAYRMRAVTEDGRRVGCAGRAAEQLEIAFAIGDYDRADPLVIDPSVVYATRVDPTIFTDNVVDSAVDADGNLWLTGMTANTQFPLTDNAIRETKSDLDDGFVVKLNAEGDVVFSTYFGGTFWNCVSSIDVDAEGNAYVGGTTSSDDFPVTGGAAQSTYAGGQGDGFLAKLGPGGQLLYSTYMGGTGYDACTGRGMRYASVAVAPDGAVYLLVSVSTSTELPAPGASRTTIDADFYLVRFDADMVVQWGRFLGSPGAGESTMRVRTDGAGNAYVLGVTSHILGAEHEFPTTPGAFQTDSESDQVHFVVKFALNGDIAYSTFLGAPTGQDASGFRGDLDVDADGNAYVVYPTGSTAAPVTPGAYQTMLRGFNDLFVTKLNPAGSALIYGTYVGGSGAEQPNLESFPIAIDEDGHAYVGGFTFSTDYPLREPLDEVGNTTNFVTKLTLDGTDIVYSTFVPQGVHTLAVGGGAVYVAGRNADGIGIGAVRVDDAGGPTPSCAGDCDGDGEVRVNEVVLGVAIALGQQAVSVCAAFDRDGNGMIDIAELIAGVGALLQGCA